MGTTFLLRTLARLQAEKKLSQEHLIRLVRWLNRLKHRNAMATLGTAFATLTAAATAGDVIATAAASGVVADAATAAAMCAGSDYDDEAADDEAADDEHVQSELGWLCRDGNMDTVVTEEAARVNLKVSRLNQEIERLQDEGSLLCGDFSAIGDMLLKRHSHSGGWVTFRGYNDCPHIVDDRSPENHCVECRDHILDLLESLAGVEDCIDDDNGNDPDEHDPAYVLHEVCRARRNPATGEWEVGLALWSVCHVQFS